jgi:uncharacterized protein
MADLATLIDAVKQGNLERVNAIVAAAPALASARMPDGDSSVMAALYRGHRHVVDALFHAGAEVDVFNAAATGRLDDLRRLLKDQALVDSISYDGWTPLHLAAFFGHAEAAQVLLENGADVNAVSANSLTNTPLHAATAGKHTDVAVLLIAHGAKTDTTDAGNYTPLQIATQNQLEAVVKQMTAARK